MKFRKNKKGFTIVELIIVIAVIGVLTAVMVPTIVHLVDKANKASDNALVSNLNKALALREAESGKKPATMHESVEGLEEYGYKLDALVAKSDQALLYNLGENKFVLANDASVAGHENEFWRIQKDAEDQTYNIYAGKGFAFGNKKVLEVSFDAGYESVSSVSYKSENDKAALIRTNNPFTDVVVYAPEKEVTHYGNANNVNITKVKLGTYVERGSVSVINLKFGKVSVEDNAFVGKLGIVNDATSETVQVENNGTIFSTTPVTYELDELGEIVEIEDSQTATEAAASIIGGVETIPQDAEGKYNLSISDADGLINLASAQSQGIVEGYLKVELTADIDLTGRTWVPFGADLDNTEGHCRKFNGSIDGKNHSIIGLSNGSYQGMQIANHTTGQIGERYGFISNSGELEISNLNFKAVDIDSENATICSPVVALAKGGSVTLDHVSVEGTVIGKDKVAGLIGYAKDAAEVEISNCVVKANLTAHDWRIGGLFGFSSGSTISISDSSYTGKVLAEGEDSNRKYVAAIGSIHATKGGVMNLSVSNFTLGEGSAVQQAVGVTAAYTQNDVVMFAKMSGTVDQKTGINDSKVITASEFSIKLVS